MSTSDGNFVPPLGQRSLTPNVIAPDGSEIRFSVDASQGATKSSVVEVTLAPGEVTRPVRHQRLRRFGTFWKGQDRFGGAHLEFRRRLLLQSLYLPVTHWLSQPVGPSNSPQTPPHRSASCATQHHPGREKTRQCLWSTAGWVMRRFRGIVCPGSHGNLTINFLESYTRIYKRICLKARKGSSSLPAEQSEPGLV